MARKKVFHSHLTCDCCGVQFDEDQTMIALFDGDVYWCGDDDCARSILDDHGNPHKLDPNDEANFEFVDERFYLREYTTRNDNDEEVTRVKIVNEDGGTVANFMFINGEFQQWLDKAVKNDHNYDDEEEYVT